ncbi:Esterase FrsA [Dickeya dianthicola]|uniref:Esterase FrsA n=1 Tax=Dickeya dianthicola TaxID=204039 RepID=A0AAP6S1D9_9GAMM|nr:esterase FrsA [Dickeya dianthicola]ATO34372.1 Fermentation/respiration switch protein [Dickeya dianthicola RNS04.9]AYC20306.1 Esterase FrsA [Dickeya dianthicola]MBI0439136.1 esterase FrsA [Dickeya dianthicola]MBI0449704.1 esterase FrsA [Dickeya dianthicola]MBI0453908.1 esterase FrsA [Dickeya dianthicola]
MVKANLSETLFKPSVKHQETSTLIQRSRNVAGAAAMQSALEGENTGNWYRMINRLLWIWRGVHPWEIEEVLSRIAASQAARSDDQRLDTVIGYRGGNWIYEWVAQGMRWQQRAGQHAQGELAGQYWLNAANLYSIAAYPHLKGDELAEQAQALANRAYEEAAAQLPYELKTLTFPIEGGGQLTAFLHLPAQESAPFPTVLMCGSLDMLQCDYHRLFQDYLAPAGVAMLTVDMPSVGFSSRWKLDQDSSFLHQQVLRALPDVPWIDHTRVGAFGFRFGANIAVRLAYLEAGRLRAVACLGPIVHHLLCDALRQQQVPDMFMDVLASRLGMTYSSDAALLVEMGRYSLKTQGLLGRRCPTPMFSGYWKDDLISPKEESMLIVNSSQQGKLLSLNFSPVYQTFHLALQQMTDWLRRQLR